jgi:starvation-inducible DNA-binding protein
MGTVRMSAKNSSLPEFPTSLFAGMEYVRALADRYAQYGAGLREQIDETDDLGDKDTADLYTEVSRGIDKRLWFLEAHLQDSDITRARGR